jgi:ADP-ribose pyrophosphatase YjhB (NUDIX family)
MEQWLSYIQRIRALAQNGLAYSPNKYDIDRYEELQQLSEAMLADLTGFSVERIADIFKDEKGYATPKVDVRGVIFKDNGILMVREKIDDCWSLPGGWADIGFTPGEIAVKEVKEESGFVVEPVKLLAVLDKRCHDHPPALECAYKIFILCNIVGGEAAPGMETSDVSFFERDKLPTLSRERNTNEQIRMLFAFLDDKDKAAIFD